MKLNLAIFEKNNVENDIKEDTVLSDFIRAYQLQFIREDNSCSTFTICYNYLIDVFTDDELKYKNITFDIIQPSENTGEYFDFFVSTRNKYVKKRNLKIFIDNDEIKLKNISLINLDHSIEDVLVCLKEQIINDRKQTLSFLEKLDITYEGKHFDNEYIKLDFDKFSNFIDNSFKTLYSIFKNEIIEYDATHLTSVLNKNKTPIKTNSRKI